MPGVVAVFVGADLAAAGFCTVPSAITYPGRGGTPVLLPERPVMAREIVRFAGEEVALVIAETAQAAADAAEEIQIGYEELPVVCGLDQALAPDAGQLHPAIPGNVCFDFEYGAQEDTARRIASAPYVVGLTLDSPRVAPCPMEPRAVLAWYDPAQDRYEIRCSNQGGRLMQKGLSAMLGVDPERIRVHRVDVGGGFGPRAAPYPEYALLLYAARALHRPVKWVATRGEDFLVDSHGRGIRLEGELAFDDDGRFLALRTDWLCDQGAYLTAAGSLTNTLNAKLIGAGPYRVLSHYGRVRLVLTNAAPTNAYRGAGRPEAAYLIERLVDEAAHKLAIDPLQLRRRNVVLRAEEPGSDRSDYLGLLDLAESHAQWHDVARRKAQALGRGKLRGVGASLFIEPVGGGFVPEDEVAIQFAGSGSVLLYTASQSNGQGHETVFPRLVADVLGMDVRRIEFRGSDPEGPPLRGNGTIGSRSMLAQGSALLLAARQVMKKGVDLAADHLEASAADIDFAAGVYLVRGTDRAVRLDALVARFGGTQPHPLDTMLGQPVPRAFSSGAHVAEVEIDPETGESEVLAYTAADDIGNVIDPVLAAGQVHGGVQQGAGQVFGERCVYDPESGQLLSGSFMDYAFPRVGLVGTIRVLDHPTPSITNALGARGVGEAGTIGSLPALMNALLDALRQAGVTRFDMPATPIRIWCALRQLEKSSGK